MIIAAVSKAMGCFFMALQAYMPVCVFDLDHTLTCGNAERAIRRCCEQGFDLAINTARPHPWLDRQLHGLGLPAPGSAAFVHNPHSYQQTAAQRARFKGEAMHRLAQHWGREAAAQGPVMPAPLCCLRDRRCSALRRRREPPRVRGARPASVVTSSAERGDKCRGRGAAGCCARWRSARR